MALTHRDVLDARITALHQAVQISTPNDDADVVIQTAKLFYNYLTQRDEEVKREWTGR